MAQSITLFYGMPDGPSRSYNCIGCDFADLESGTEYTVHFTQTYTQNDTELKTVAINVNGAGLLKVGGLSTGTKLLPDAVYDLYDGVYTLNASFTEVPIGQKPSDWDARWKDLYYTRSELTYGDDTAHVYSKVGKTWSPATQYYKTADLSKLFFTANGSYFGVGISQSGDPTIRTDLGALWLGEWGSPSTESMDPDINPFIPMWLGSSGLCIIAGTSYQSPSWRNCLSQNRTTTFNISQNMNTNFYMCSCTYNGEEYGGIAMVDVDAYGQPTGIGMYLIGKEFFSGSIEPGTPGDWGNNGGVHNPAERHAVTFSVNNDISPIGSTLQTTSWTASTGEGVHIYCTDATNYGNLLKGAFTSDTIDSIVNGGWRSTDYIMAAHKIPFGNGIIPVLGPSVPMRLGGKQIAGASGKEPDKRIYEIDCGSVTIERTTGHFMDYDCSIELFLPFIGSVALEPEKVLGSTLYLTYRIDLLTGDCVAYVKGTPNYPDEFGLVANQTVIYVGSGNCAFSIPIPRTDGGIMNKLNYFASIASLGVSAAMGAATGNAAGVIGSLGGVAGAANQRNKQSVSVSGMTANPAAFSHLKPYVWVKYPMDINPDQFTETQGRMAELGGTVEYYDIGGGTTVNYEGYQEYSSVNVSGISTATDAEKAEIEALLKGGIYL